MAVKRFPAQGESLEPRQMLTAAIVGAGTADEGVPYTVQLSSDVTPDEWQIDWGDGVVETLDGNATSASHFYNQAGDKSVQAWAVSGGAGEVFQDAAGLVAVEAENYSSLTSGSGSASGKQWETLAD